MDIQKFLLDLELSEDLELEFKESSSSLPKTLWESVSAFANTQGGLILLGIRELKNGIEIQGVQNSGQLIKDFWNSHNNPQKLSAPLCGNSDVLVHKVGEKDIISIQIPKTNRNQRPIYISGHPYRGSYKRNHEGDYHCTEDEVKQMIRDASSDPQDLQILDGFTLDDLDNESIKAYRQRFISREPDHPWLAMDDKGLLQQLGGWRKDRGSSNEGLTLSGILMFGRERSILDALPHYQLDFQERLSYDPEQRWTYRLTLDGKWESNLFNFYYQVYSRLIRDLDVPFQLDKDSVRKGETHVHEALREALVNCLIHADHLSTKPINITRFSDTYSFSNPGRLRIPLGQLYEGGVSDPRNPNLQRMFQMLGLGEKAGSGFGKILRAWSEQKWWQPFVSERLDIEVTSVALPMVSMIPEQITKEIKAIVGNDYPNLNELDCTILALAHRFGNIGNTNIQQYRNEHPQIIGECLKRHVQQGWLEQSGKGRGTYYSLVSSNTFPAASELPATTDEHKDSDSEHKDSDSEHKDSDSEHKDSDSEHKDSNSEHEDFHSEHSEASSASEAAHKNLIAIALPVRNKRRADPAVVKAVIFELCLERFISLKDLSDLLTRSPDTLRTHYLAGMITEKLLELRYPEQINHPHQAYRSCPKPEAQLSLNI
jgi:ATP-dependent DNA helicase RecG